MGLPSKRYSKRRTRARRGHHALETVSVNICSQCGTSTLPHHACSACGYYKKDVKVNVKANLNTNK